MKMGMKKTITRGIIISGLLIMTGSFSSFAEIGPGVTGTWQADEQGWWYENPNGTYAQSEWKEIKDTWYYFDENGYMKTGWVDSDGKRYWLDQNGAMAKDCVLVLDGLEYTFAADGSASAKVKEPTEIPAEDAKSELHHTVDQIADGILAQITNGSMTQRQKAEAIYDWIRANTTYVNTSEKGDWVKSAYEGFRRKRGDCYVYYSMSLALLNRAGIPSIEVIRSDGHHWWNLINCGDGWYHFDTTPRPSHTKFFMWTDAQLEAYSQEHRASHYPNGTHSFDHNLYPATPLQ